MFDSIAPDALDNALRIDMPTRKPGPGLFAGSGAALAHAPAAGTMDFLSFLSPVLDTYGKTVAFTEGQSKESTINQIGDNSFGREVRAEARRLTPDPATTGVAAEALFGVGRVLTKAVPLAIMGGTPAAALGTGGIEGTVAAQDLMDEGVDTATAVKVGGTKGVLTAAQIALPMSAGTKLGTAGLALAGGPGGFMAEQAASRYILEHADYADIARRYNPLDPTGLTVSTLMAGGFGAAGHMSRARAARAAEKPPIPEIQPGVEITPDQIAAARVHLAAEHVQNTGMYRPGDLAGSIAHVNALETAARQMDAGERVEVGDIVNPENLHPPRAADAVEAYAERVARTEVLDRTRAELLATASARAEPGVIRSIEQERPPIVAALADLENSFKERAKAAQAEGLSRKQAEAAARAQIADVRTELEGRLARMDQQVEANRTAAKAEQDLGAVESGDLPQHIQALVDERIAQIQQGLQPRLMATAIADAFPAEQVHTALKAEQVPVSPENVAAVQLIARARQVDAAAVDALPHDMPDAEYLARVKEIADAEQNHAAPDQNRPQPGARPEAGAAPTAKTAEAPRGEAAAAEPAAGAAGQVAEKAPDAVETAARQAADIEPGAMVPDPETGVLVAAKQLLAEAEALYQQRVVESKAYQAAVTCFLRH